MGNSYKPHSGKPTWGRAMEPPSFGFFAERADEVLVTWYFIETDSDRKERIEDTLVRFLKYWKYDAPPVNGSTEWVNTIGEAGSDPSPYWNESQMNNYDPEDINTWWWWLWYNHDADDGEVNIPVSARSQNPGPYYVRHLGEAALITDHYNTSGYPMLRNTVAFKIGHYLQENPDGFNWSSNRLDYYCNSDTEKRFFGRWDCSNGYVERSINEEFDGSTGFFGTRTVTIDSKTYTAVSDSTFYTRMRFLPWGIENTSGALTDSDGDGFSDTEEQSAGSDVLDSEQTPNNLLEDPSSSNSNGGGSSGCFIHGMI